MTPLTPQGHPERFFVWIDANPTSACLRVLRSVILNFLEFLNVFRKWYDAGTTGQEGGGASMPEGMFERVESC